MHKNNKGTAMLYPYITVFIKKHGTSYYVVANFIALTVKIIGLCAYINNNLLILWCEGNPG